MFTLWAFSSSFKVRPNSQNGEDIQLLVMLRHAQWGEKAGRTSGNIETGLSGTNCVDRKSLFWWKKCRL
jgi:hypothetical protein